MRTFPLMHRKARGITSVSAEATDCGSKYGF